MISVGDIERSIAFYSHLGFAVGNTFTPGGATKPSWAWLESGEAQLMLSQASEDQAVNPQGFIFYAYTDDVDAARVSIFDAGLNPGEMRKPFYNPHGEFEVLDPDGYVVMVTHT